MNSGNSTESLKTSLLTTDADLEREESKSEEQKGVEQVLQLGHQINPIKIKELEEYLQNYVLDGQDYRLSKKEMSIRTATALLGAGWGVPWRDAAASAAVIFPQGIARTMFETIFAGGIVVTVGADGLWLMLEIGNQLGSKSPEEAILTKQQKSTCIKVSQAVFPALFSFLSCISAVYASVTYNSGPQQLLGILTLIDNYAYGLYGYSKLTRNFYNNILKFKSDPDYKSLLDIRSRLVNRVNTIATGNAAQPKDINDFAKYLYSNDEVENNNIVNQSSRSRKMFQLLSTTMISAASYLVGVFLAKEFLQDNIYDNAALAITVALVAEIPALIVTSLSTKSMFGRLYDSLVCRQSDESRRALVKEIHPIASLMIPFLIFPISLTAPSAGAFVTYTTFGKEDVSNDLQWTATAAIIAARVVFSNYTLNKLSEELLLKIYEMRHGKDDAINQRIRLRKFADVLGRTNLTFFKPLLTRPNAANEQRLEEASLTVSRPDDEDEKISQPALPINPDVDVDRILMQPGRCGIM